METKPMRLQSNQFNFQIYNGAERRMHLRVEKPIIIRFRIRTCNGQKMDSTDWDMVGVNDLSVGGLFFNSNYNIQKGTTLELKIGFSTSSAPVKCIGLVTRVKKQPHTSIFGIAAVFMDLKGEEKELINRYVNETLLSYLAGTN